MSPHVQRQAFDPFFSTRRLGLQIVHRISEPGAGTSVRLILPRSIQFDSGTATHRAAL
jgi:signal transduction histidine kinase